MIYFEIAILAFMALLTIIIMIVSTCKFIQDRKLYNGWKKRQEIADIFCAYHEAVTGEKINIKVLLNTDDYEFEYTKEDK